MSRVLPILFNTDMVRAILRELNPKTATRRCIKGFIPDDAIWGYTAFTPKGCISCRGTFADGYGEKFFKSPCQPGDILYVRETWKKAPNGYYYYEDWQKDDIADVTKWCPSIHMPKEAARIWLKVTDVRVEQLQEITEKQALSEGVPDDLDYPISKVYCPRCRGEGLIGALSQNLGFMEVDCPDCDTAVKRFKNLWNSTIKKFDRYGWNANPWVWVIGFELCEKPEESQYAWNDAIHEMTKEGAE